MCECPPLHSRQCYVLSALTYVQIPVEVDENESAHRNHALNRLSLDRLNVFGELDRDDVLLFLREFLELTLLHHFLDLGGK